MAPGVVCWLALALGAAADEGAQRRLAAASPLELLLRRHPLLAAPARCPTRPPVYELVLERSIAHDSDSFLQGLAMHDHVLFEAAGLYGRSSLRVVDARNGSVLRANHLGAARRHGSVPGAMLTRPAQLYFAEGVTHWRGQLFMLTWREGSLLVHDARTLALLREHRGFADQLSRREGWGITADETRLYVSDGSSDLYVVDPDTLRVESTIRVAGLRPARLKPPRHKRDAAPALGWEVGEVKLLNELEMLPNGVLLFNVWFSDYIGIFDVRRRCLLGWINGTGLDAAFSSRRRQGACLNGIAFDETSGELLISGKLWPVMHAIRLAPPRPAG